MYYLFKAYFELEKQSNDGWVGYDALKEYMENQDYSAAFRRGAEEFYVTYMPDYNSLNIFEERKSEIDYYEMRLNHSFDAAALRRAFELFDLPYQITETGAYKDKNYGCE